MRSIPASLLGRSAARTLRLSRSAIGKFLHRVEIPKFCNEPTLVGIEEPVDFRLADWLFKGDTGEHLE